MHTVASIPQRWAENPFVSRVQQGIGFTDRQLPGKKSVMGLPSAHLSGVSHKVKYKTRLFYSCGHEWVDVAAFYSLDRNGKFGW